MAIKKDLGGDRLGSGNKMPVTMHGYGRSTFNLSKIRRTTMSVGTVVPMGVWQGLAGDRWEIDLDALITTNATMEALYGSFKFQIDVFTQRLANFNPKMTLNLVEQGLQVKDIKFPQVRMKAERIDWTKDPSNQQTNPSSIWAYLGFRGIGGTFDDSYEPERDINAHAYLMYHALGKEYFSNKQEGKGYIIHSDAAGFNETVSSVEAKWRGQTGTISEGTGGTPIWIYRDSEIHIQTDGDLMAKDIMFNTDNGKWSGSELFETDMYDLALGLRILGSLRPNMISWVDGWEYREPTDLEVQMPRITSYDLSQIDKMQMQILEGIGSASAKIIDENSLTPYSLSLKKTGKFYSKMSSQEGLILKTYQSDLFNNWLNTTWINNIRNQSMVSTAGGQFSIDSLLINQKVYNYLNRVAAAGGTLDDWREVTYDHKSYTKSMKPVYEGGLSKEIVFDQVVSTAATADSPLGSIAARGTFGSKHKGGKVSIRLDEESMIMVVASITPRLTYSQGNRFYNNLKTLDDLYKPEFGKIGYQDLITEQMYYIGAKVNSDGTMSFESAGKQPAWANYKTDYDDNLGNFAGSEKYMVLDRNYGWTAASRRIQDVTTYIDPSKFNDIFAYKALDAQNFRVQVGMEIKTRRTMEGSTVPNM